MTNDVSFKRPEYIEALDRWLTVRDVCAGQHRVVDRLPYINRHDKSEENIERNKSYRERAVFKNATGHTRNGLIGLAFHKDPTLTVPASSYTFRTMPMAQASASTSSLRARLSACWRPGGTACSWTFTKTAALAGIQSS